MIDKSVKDKVLELSKQKKSLREIASELKIGKTTVSSIIKKSEIPEVVVKEPELIINELNIEMDKGMTDDFLQSIISDSVPTKEPGMDQFINNLVAEIQAPEKKKRGRPAAVPKTPKFSSFIPTAPAPAAAATPAVPVLEKGELIAKITLHVNTFPDVLDDYIKPNRDDFLTSLGKKTQTELSALMSSMNYTRSVNNTANVMKSLTLTGASLLEMGTKRFLKMRTDGFSQLIASTSELDSILKEIAMENQNGIISKYQSPTVRLTTLVITSLMSIDAKNRMGGNIQAPENIEQKYNDL